MTSIVQRSGQFASAVPGAREDEDGGPFQVLLQQVFEEGHLPVAWHRIDHLRDRLGGRALRADGHVRRVVQDRLAEAGDSAGMVAEKSIVWRFCGNIAMIRLMWQEADVEHLIGFVEDERVQARHGASASQ